MVTNHVYDREHNTAEVKTNLTASKLPANSSYCLSLRAQDIQTIYRSVRQTLTLINNKIN